MFESPYIFGLHDPGGEQIMADAGRRGWLLFTVEVGSNPDDYGGFDFSAWTMRDFGIICRVNHGYGSAGTLPPSSRYGDFARRVANFVAGSRGCKIWVIGNEMNHSQEWPDTSAGFEPITPVLYASCFRQCRDAVKALPGHDDDQLVIGAVAPWNNQTTYPGNQIGDWVCYFADALRLASVGGLDGIALHTYTHGSDPALIHDRSTMDPPFDNRYYNFQAYRDFMVAIPEASRRLPVYITETDQDDPWVDENNGWVQSAYAEIDHWNRLAGAQQIRALVLYRWPRHDRWYIEGKNGVIDDFRAAMRNEYRWRG